MPAERRGPARWQRALALAAITLAGLASLVGSGGGLVGFPPCEGPYCSSDPPLPPQPTVSVQPAYVTALVGSEVRLTATTANFSGTPSFQWRRSSDGGRSYQDVAGATGPTLTLAAVNLADDGAMFAAVASSGSGFRTMAASQLTVSAVPGLVVADAEFQITDWSAEPFVPAGGSPSLHDVSREAAGGHPGAWRRMALRMASDVSAVAVTHWFAAAYDPASQGAIRVVDYAEDCIALQDADFVSTESRLAVEQDARLYVTRPWWTCPVGAWGTAAGRASLGPQDFEQLRGPACPAGANCPDFSAGAAPLRWGYRRTVFGRPGETAVHGIDNWTVTVWRR